MTILFSYAIAALLVYSFIFRKLINKHEFRGVTVYLSISGITVFAVILALFSSKAVNTTLTFFFVYISILMFFVSIQISAKFAHVLKYGHSSKYFDVIYILGFIQAFVVALSDSFKFEFMNKVSIVEGRYTFEVGNLYYINAIVSFALLIYSVVIISTLMKKYRITYLIVTGLLLTPVLYIGFTVSNTLHLLPLLSLYGILMISARYMFVFRLENLFISKIEVDNNIIKYLHAYYIVIDTEGNIVRMIPNIKDSGIKDIKSYTHIDEIYEDFYQEDTNIYKVDERFYRIFSGGLISSDAEEIIYIIDITSSYKYKQLLLSTYLVCPLTQAYTLPNFHLQYKNTDILADKALIYYDLDGLKKINDTLGHDAGDKLISEFAMYLIKRYRPDKVYRIGGDEFVVVIDKDNLDTVALDKINDIKFRDNTIPVKYSIGIAVIYNVIYNEVDEYVKIAERLMYVCKYQTNKPEILELH